MRFTIRHEIKKRLRIHLHMKRMSFREADTFEYYLSNFDEIKEVKVYERTADAVIFYDGDRDRALDIIGDFSFENTQVPKRVFESSGRELSAAKRKGLLHEELHSKVEYIVAHGIASEIKGKRAVIGSFHFVFEDEKVLIPEDKMDIFDLLPDEYSHLYFAKDGSLCACILIEDPMRDEVEDVISKLKAQGFKNIVMMTGDSEKTAGRIAAKAGISEYYSEVLPEDKAGYIERVKASGKKVIMVGDGINDSPALSASDAGIAISEGAEIARQIADITISSSDLESIVTLRELSTLLMKRINFNYRSIVFFNTALIALGIAGIMPPATSAMLHNGSTVSLGLKSMTKLLPSEPTRRRRPLNEIYS